MRPAMVERIQHVPPVYFVQKRIDGPQDVADFAEHGFKLLPRLFRRKAPGPGILERACAQPGLVCEQFPHPLEDPRPVARQIVRSLEPAVCAVEDVVRVNVVMKVQKVRNVPVCGQGAEPFVMILDALRKHLERIAEGDGRSVGVEHGIVPVFGDRFPANERIHGDDMAFVLGLEPLFHPGQRLEKRLRMALHVHHAGIVAQLLRAEPAGTQERPQKPRRHRPRRLDRLVRRGAFIHVFIRFAVFFCLELSAMRLYVVDKTGYQERTLDAVRCLLEGPVIKRTVRARERRKKRGRKRAENSRRNSFHTPIVR